MGTIAAGRPCYGWIVVAAAFVLMGVGFGLVYSLGDYVAPLSRDFGASRGSVSFVFGLTAILSLTGGALTGPLADRLGPRPLALAAALAYLAGMGLASRAQGLWQVALPVGVGVGCGVAAVYVPSVATVQRWFDRRRALASVIATSGLGAGTLVGPVVAGSLIAGHDWRIASLVTGVAGSVLTMAAGWLMIRPSEPGLVGTSEPGRAIEGGHTLAEAVRTGDFRWLYVAILGTCAVAFFGYGQIVPYAEGRGLAPLTAALGLAAVGAGSLLGRVCLAPVTQWLGLRRSYVASTLALAAAMLAWLVLPVPPLACLLAVGFALGAAFGVFVGLSPALIADRFGQRSLTTIIGVIYTGGGVGALLGPWLGGRTFDATGSYHAAALGGAAVAALAAVAAGRIGVDPTDQQQSLDHQTRAGEAQDEQPDAAD